LEPGTPTVGRPTNEFDGKRQKSTRFTDRVKEGRKGLPLSRTGYEKGAFTCYYSNRYAKLLVFLVSGWICRTYQDSTTDLLNNI